MKVASLFHNPKAGDSTHDKHELVSLIDNEDFKCVYISTKGKKWDIDKDADIGIIAGGDGTVRKVAAYMLKKMKKDIPPLALLPLGTANNIASALNISSSPGEIIASLNKRQAKPFDIGSIDGLNGQDFFLESFGCGIFANLMNAMKKKDHKEKSASEKLNDALRTMLEIAGDYEARECKLEIDGNDYSGSYLMAEVMNINSIGPNLLLSPFSDTSDGIFEIVLIAEKDRKQLVQYLENRVNGIEEAASFRTIQGRNIKIKWEGLHVHVDDKIVKEKKEIKAKVEAEPGRLQFLM